MLMPIRALSFSLAIFAVLSSGCAQLHHVQIGDLYGDQGDLAPFEIKVSETGVNIGEAASIAKATTQNASTRKTISNIETIIAMFQYGPRTGNLVYDEKYTDEVSTQIRAQCPSGRITGLMAIRESRKYPVISGEIIKIKGYCVQARSKGTSS